MACTTFHVLAIAGCLAAFAGSSCGAPVLQSVVVEQRTPSPTQDLHPPANGTEETDVLVQVRLPETTHVALSVDFNAAVMRDRRSYLPDTWGLKKCKNMKRLRQCSRDVETRNKCSETCECSTIERRNTGWPFRSRRENILPRHDCAADHGTSIPSSGQGGGDVPPKYQCPAETPRCTAYEYGVQWGTCRALHDCAANHGTSIPSSGQGGGDVPPKYQCPAETPRCTAYEYGVQWGTCQGGEWYNAYSPSTFEGAEHFCASKGRTLATFDEYCVAGKVFGGKQGGDQWAPYSGEGDNQWVQVGTSGHDQCKKHYPQHGKPAWGTSIDKQPWENYVLCVEQIHDDKDCNCLPTSMLGDR